MDHTSLMIIEKPMKYLILILITFSLNTFAHEIEDHPKYWPSNCDLGATLYAFPDSSDELKKELHHYLGQGCDLSAYDLIFNRVNSRIQKILRITSWKLYTSILKRLINELHVDLNTTFIFEDDEISPLYHATHSASLYGYALTEEEHQKYLEFIELLLKNGADVNWKDKYGRTTLMIASVKSNNANKALFDLLIKHGADLDNLTDSQGHTGRDYLNAKPPEEYNPHWTPFDKLETL